MARGDDGTWTVTLADGSTRRRATPSSSRRSPGPPSRSCAPIDAEIADALAAIPASSSATVSFAFDEDEIGIDMNAFGVLCPAVEKRALLAATYSSTKWPGRAPKGTVLLRGFVGGPQQPGDHGEERRGDHARSR